MSDHRLQVSDRCPLSIAALDLGQDPCACSLEKLLPYVSDETRRKVERFRRREDGCRTAVGELLARFMLSACCSVDAGAIVIVRDSFGKPFWSGKRECHFSVSHSGRWVVVAVDSRHVGIDIERIGPVEAGLEKTCFSDAECRKWHSLDDERRERFFFELWTAKESYIKMAGRGLDLPLASFTIELGPGREAHLVSHAEGCPPAVFRSYDIDGDYCLTLCAAHAVFPSGIKMVTVDELETHFIKG